jgi:hypothetical protein
MDINAEFIRNKITRGLTLQAEWINACSHRGEFVDKKISYNALRGEVKVEITKDDKIKTRFFKDVDHAVDWFNKGES